MTLHEAIIEVLNKSGRSMTTQKIANELSSTGLYRKKDGSEISAFQIHGRTRKYSDLFDRDGSTVSLKGTPGKRKPESKAKDKFDKLYAQK